MRLIRNIFPGKRLTLAGTFLIAVTFSILLNLLPGGSLVALLCTITAIVTGIILIFRLVPLLVRKSIWRLRNRLLVNYLFIAVVPIVLILLLVGIGGYTIAGQTGTYLVVSELQRTLSSLTIPSHVLSVNPIEAHPAVLRQVSYFLMQRFPEFEVIERSGARTFRYPATSTMEPLSADIPDYNGVIVRDGHYWCLSHSHNGDTTVDVMAPLDRQTLAMLIPKIGAVNLIPGLASSSEARLFNRRKERLVDAAGEPVGVLPPPANRFDYEVAWPMSFRVSSLSTQAIPKLRQEQHILMLSTRPSALIATIFGDTSTQILSWLYIFVAIASLFLIMELAALVIGVRLFRTITGAMESLYDGTRRVAAGDFTHRIAVKGNDQLAAVSESFNGMTRRIEELIVVAKEKERLESELEIACEVQSQLFPRCSPVSKSLEISGVCRPARMVSGDYYDYLALGGGNLAMALGDVAGKGISAALLMASIQSIMRTQLGGAVPAMAATANGQPRTVYSTSKMVSQLNRQLYESTSPEKYATFLFGIYDEHEHTFTYTNAGHLPPILLRRGAATLLEVTGTVVGAFPLSLYEEQTIQLEPGDLLVSYTDGVTEPENAYGEEFGTERLIDSVTQHRKLGAQEMMGKVLDAVRLWTVAPELPDDMTLVMARRLG